MSEDLDSVVTQAPDVFEPPADAGAPAGSELTTGLTVDEQRRLAGMLYNRVWDLIDRGDQRTDEEAIEMVEAAHASRHFWRGVGGTQEAIVGEWQISRAYAFAGIGPMAVRHASQAVKILNGSTEELADWVAPSVFEGMARALVSAGRAPEATRWCDRAFGASAQIQDPADRKLIQSQITELTDANKAAEAPAI